MKGKLVASLEYFEGATGFVTASARRLGDPTEILCPCTHCRNLSHQVLDKVTEHLVIRGMDKKYMRSSCWSLHGERRSDMNDNSEFRKKLRDAETPLYLTCSKHTKVSAIMALYRIKVKSGMSEAYFDQLLSALHDMLPEGNVLPKSTDSIKKFLKIFGFGYEMIHACKNDCILYRKQYEELETCPRCSASRWEIDKHSNEEKKGIPAKVLRMAEDLRWHANNATEDGIMRHPVDSLSWAQVNNKWPEFASEARNLRLGLSTDGMNPFSIQNTNEGIQVYDSFLKEKFTLKAMLLWTISDYPALGSLAGCKVKGKQACNVCGKDTPNRWLKFSRKYVYLGNRKRLSPGHHYRRRKGWFDNTVEKGTANRIQTGAEIFATLKNFRNDFGRSLAKKKKRKRNVVSEDEVAEDEENDETSDQWRWKKRSIFFDLPYWKDLPVRHNIDVMHVEKNLSDALLSTLMQSAKSKDGLKARQDLEDIGIRKNLHTQVRGKRFYLPPATYWLSKEEKKIFCQRLSAFRGPDGYCGNIANVVSINPPMIGSLKSHDHHVLIQNLLPAALRGLLPRGPRVAVTRIPSNSKEHSTKLRWLAFGPRFTAHTNKGFVINGNRFHIQSVKRKTQNSGVTYEAFSMCRSSARDTRHTADMVTYYGVITEIILLDYHMFSVPLFKCNWANRGYGVKEEDGFTLVNLHVNQTPYLQDPYILPSQAKQVFYSREDEESPWYVVMRAPPRGYHELETEEDVVGAPLLAQEFDDTEQLSDDESFCVRDDCDGIIVAD
ncbi:hypothetical protein BRARA_K00924 [Brassica rapa]|uniref:Transposase-associated domain-containing protein n=1 Tax=Brassica campestris TaxID=3711 RepID=A0A397L281_BRACM|nr:hypothetical protein BRARA_K00924 [Brassica rapa]